MPSSKKYKIIKNDPEKYRKYLEEKKLWMRERRKRRIFKHFSEQIKTKYQSNIRVFDLWRIAKKQKLICPLTGRRLTYENISLDHIIPLDKGGKTTINNIQFVDYHANLAKSTLTKEELIQLCNDIITHNQAKVKPLLEL